MRRAFLIVALFALLALPVVAAAPDYHFNWVEVLSDMESKTEEYNMELACLAGEMEYFDIAGIGPMEAASSSGRDLRVETLDYSSRIFFERPLREGETQF
ncbi:hypothetical protein KKA03_05465, partial [archaeon]|nr:hypothetical protein [archaeon]